MTPKQRALAIVLGSFLACVTGTIGFIWWDRGAPPGFKPTLVDVTIESINRNNRGVRIHGMARHDVRIKQENNNDPQDITYVFPLVPADKMNSKYIKVLIRTTQKPDSMATIEEMTIEGLARPPGRLVNREIIEAWKNKGYEFDPKYVLIEHFTE